jgi:hypothetical protein
MEDNLIFRSGSVTARLMAFVVSDSAQYKHNESLECPKRTAFKLCDIPRISHRPNRVALRLASVNVRDSSSVSTGKSTAQMIYNLQAPNSPVQTTSAHFGHTITA